MPNDINVNRNTTLAQLHDFARDHGDTARLRGRRNDDGSIQLYVKTGKPSFFSKISPGAISHRDLAREAVRTAFRNADRTAGYGIIDNNVRTALDKGIRNDIKGLSLKILTEAGQATKASNRGPGLAECGTLKDNLGGIADRLKNATTPQERSTIARDLGAMIARDFAANNPGREEDFVLSHGLGLKYDLREALGELAGTGKVSLDFVDKAFAHAAHELSPDKMNDDGSLRLNNKDYARKELLGEGAFGKVWRYEASDGTSIALKLPKVIETSDRNERLVRADMVDEFAGEVRAHRAALGPNGHPNITKLEGVVRTPGGDLGIALEILPGGSAFDAMSKIQEKVDAGLLDKTAANAVRMTLFHDIAKGLAHLHKEGLTHLDFKSPNCLIGADGVARIADFGTTIDAGDFHAGDYKRPDNPQWLASELVRSSGQVADEVGKNRTRGEIKDTIASQFKGLKNVGNDFITKVQNYDTQETRAGMQLQLDAGKTDTWSLGVTGFNLIYGREMVRGQGGYASDDATRIANFGNDPNNRAINTGVPDGSPNVGNSFAGSTGFAPIDELLNMLMHPDPNQRPDMQDVLDHPAFRMPGAGSNEARELIKELMSPTPDDTRIASLGRSFTPHF